MDLPLSRAIVPDLQWRERCPSTNSELVARASELADLSVLATTDQTAGRGRLDRTWSAGPGAALAVSLLVRIDPPLDPQRLGWLPLLAGVAMARAARTLGVDGAGVKWPNDVLVDGAKLSGILAELTPVGVVIGAGLNLSMTRDQLPVLTATSLLLEGVPTTPDLTDRALAAYLSEVLVLIAQWRAVASPAALRAVVEAELQTLGRAVRVDRPGLPVMLGIAEGIDDDGRLLVRPEQGSSAVAVAAGDVTHLRYE